MPHHKHLHAKREHHHWDEIVEEIEKVAKKLNPLKDAPSPTVQARAPETIIKTRYTTLSATFDGPVAGFTTVGVPAETTDKPDAGKPTTVHHSGETPVPDADTHKPSLSLPESLAPTGSLDPGSETTLALAGTTSRAVPSQTASAGTTVALFPTDAATSSTPPPVSDDSDDGGAGVKAGIAIGVLGGLLAIGLLIFFLFNRRKKKFQKDQEQADEKFNTGFVGGRAASVRSTQAPPNAPQLSLRPVTQFNPSFNERRSSKGAGVMLGAGAASGPSASKWERPITAHSNNPENPFNDTARAYSPVANESSASQQPTNPFNSPEHVVGVAQTTDVPSSPVSPTPPATTAVESNTVAVAVGAASGAAAADGLARKVSVPKEEAEPLDLTMPAGPPSPTGTEFSVHSVAPGQSPGPSKSAAAIAEAGGPPATAVHRVQLDFKPSMEDELDLQAGQLVRILHEYDDGWALCIRLDRSRQGVVPRTCLSTRPVKPRPAGGPPGARNGGPPINPSGQRGPRGPRGPGPNHPNYPPGSPHGRPESPMHGRPQSPAHMRPYSPAGGPPMSPRNGRPTSPASGRPMSPGPRQQRPQSPNGMNRRNSPPGPSPMNPNSPGFPQQQRGPPGPPPQGQVGRKPVPGQAY
ncbi:hypothetical protein GGS20DRAFT_424250 [Poronia punctata]|nr:hypothetical protein GGS20DRAFT_424250 [Poronia punctata]